MAEMFFIVVYLYIGDIDAYYDVRALHNRGGKSITAGEILCFFVYLSINKYFIVYFLKLFDFIISALLLEHCHSS